MLPRLFKYLLTWCGVGVSKARYEWINSSAFLASQEWIELRYRVLRESDGRCCLCGRGAIDGAKLNVVHIKPRRTHPSLALARSNDRLSRLGGESAGYAFRVASNDREIGARRLVGF